MTLIHFNFSQPDFGPTNFLMSRDSGPMFLLLGYTKLNQAWRYLPVKNSALMESLRPSGGPEAAR
jgi:hypothetical protein